MRLREKYQLKNIEVELIIEEEAALDEELVESIDETEQYQPIQVMTVENLSGNEMYKVIDGRRRVIAAKLLGQKTIMALVVNEVSEEEFLLRALSGNSGKANAMDEAYHMAALEEKGFSREAIAKKARYDKWRVDWTLHLLKLIPEFQELVKRGTRKRTDGLKPGLPFSTGYEISRLPHSEQLKLYVEWDAGKKLTAPYVNQFIKNWQAAQIGATLTDDDGSKNKNPVKKGLFISADQIEKALAGEIVEVNYNGDILEVKLNGKPVAK